MELIAAIDLHRFAPDLLFDNGFRVSWKLRPPKSISRATGGNVYDPAYEDWRNLDVVPLAQGLAGQHWAEVGVAVANQAAHAGFQVGRLGPLLPLVGGKSIF